MRKLGNGLYYFKNRAAQQPLTADVATVRANRRSRALSVIFPTKVLPGTRAAGEAQPLHAIVAEPKGGENVLGASPGAGA